MKRKFKKGERVVVCSDAGYLWDVGDVVGIQFDGQVAVWIDEPPGRDMEDQYPRVATFDPGELRRKRK